MELSSNILPRIELYEKRSPSIINNLTSISCAINVSQKISRPLAFKLLSRILYSLTLIDCSILCSTAEWERSGQHPFYCPLSDGIISIRCRGQGPNITIFQVYAPATSYSDKQVEDLYATLQSKIDVAPKQDIIIIMGDWNAKVSKDHETWGPTIRKFGYGEMNDRGEHLLYFCKENSLIVSDTLFKHKPSRKWTWTPPDHKSKNMIDLILIRDRWRSAVDNTRSFQSVDIGSDHSLSWQRSELSSKLSLRRKKWNITKLDDPSIAKDFQLQLQNRFQMIEDEVDTNDPITDSLLEKKNHNNHQKSSR